MEPSPSAPAPMPGKRRSRLEWAVQLLAFATYGAWNFRLPDLKPNEVTREAAHALVEAMQLRGALALALFVALAVACVMLLRLRPIEAKSGLIVTLSVAAASYGLWRGWSFLSIDQRVEAAFLLDPEVALPDGWVEAPRRSPIIRSFTNSDTNQTLAVWTMGSGILGKMTCVATLVEAASGLLAGALKTPDHRLLPTEYTELPSPGPGICQIRVAAAADRAESDFGLWPCPAAHLVYFSYLSSPRSAPLQDLGSRIVCRAP